MLTSRAVAYLKPAISDDGDVLAIKLSQADTPVMLEIGHGLLVTYLVDRGNSFSYIQYRDLDRDAITEAQLHSIGIANLLSLTETNELRVVPHSNIYAVFLDGNFEASLILANSLWHEAFRQFVRNDYLVAIPSRDILAFCDSSSDVGRTELLQVIDRLKGVADHPISTQLFIRSETSWQLEKAV